MVQAFLFSLWLYMCVSASVLLDIHSSILNVCSPNQLAHNKYNWTVTETVLLLVTENYQRSAVNWSVIFDNIYLFFSFSSPGQNVNMSACRSTSTPTPPLVRGMPPHIPSPHPARLMTAYSIASAAALSNSPIAAGFGMCLFVVSAPSVFIFHSF